jgi:RNA polymerase sigma-70 factor, ECF subfamily
MNKERHDQFAEHFVRNENKVYRYILTLVPNWADADELFQQTCLTIWKRWEEFDLARPFTPWACGIAHNLVRNFARKRERGQLTLDEEVIDALGALRIDRDDLLEERRAALAGCMGKLPAEQRDLIEDYYAGGQDVGALARRIGRTSNVVYKLLRKIRAALHDCVTLRMETGGGT